MPGMLYQPGLQILEQHQLSAVLCVAETQRGTARSPSVCR